MTKTETFKSCIEKGIKGGYVDKHKIKTVNFIEKGYVYYFSQESRINTMFHINEVLFDPNFLKAFFGEHMVCSNKGNSMTEDDCVVCDINNYCKSAMTGIPMWQYHGFELLKSDDRLEYMSKFL